MRRRDEDQQQPGVLEDAVLNPFRIAGETIIKETPIGVSFIYNIVYFCVLFN